MGLRDLGWYSASAVTFLRSAEESEVGKGLGWFRRSPS
jgi:hypothetical protein